MYLDDERLTVFIGEHPNLVLSYSVQICERYQFLFLRLMRELVDLSNDKLPIHIYIVEIDETTGIPTPHLDVMGSVPDKINKLCDRYEHLYNVSRCK